MHMHNVEEKVAWYEKSTSPGGNGMVLINVLQKTRETSFLKMINICHLCVKSNSRAENWESAVLRMPWKLLCINEGFTGN